MSTYWRVSNYSDLSGGGGRKAGARWHTTGSRIVYLADSPMSALVESLVHLDLDNDETPDFYTLLKISAPDELAVKPLDSGTENEWKQNLELTRAIGDAWLTERETALARVPSVIAPRTWNYLLNPEHPDAKHVQVAEIIREPFDNRLFRFGAR